MEARGARRAGDAAGGRGARGAEAPEPRRSQRRPRRTAPALEVETESSPSRRKRPKPSRAARAGGRARRCREAEADAARSGRSRNDPKKPSNASPRRVRPDGARVPADLDRRVPRARLLTYATAIAMRAFIGFVSLTFLGDRAAGRHRPQERLAGAHRAGDRAEADASDLRRAQRRRREDLHEQLGGADRVRRRVRGLAGLGRRSRAVMDALNAIIECDDERSMLRSLRAVRRARRRGHRADRDARSSSSSCLGRLLGESGGVWHWLVAVLRWPVGAVFLGLAVGVVARFAPVEHRGVRWASVGAALIVVAWLVESAIYAWYLKNFAELQVGDREPLAADGRRRRTSTSRPIVFLVGAQLDEFLREESKGREVIGIYESRAARLLTTSRSPHLYSASTAVGKACGSSRSERKTHPQRRPPRLRTYVPLWLLSATIVLVGPVHFCTPVAPGRQGVSTPA